jgi:hypothetical protein
MTMAGKPHLGVSLRGVGGVHRISALLMADDPVLFRQGRVELARALQSAGGVAAAARMLGQSEQTLWRWIRRADIVPPDGRHSEISDREIADALRRNGSARGAAKELGLSHTGIRKRALAAGISLPSGRHPKG